MKNQITLPKIYALFSLIIILNLASNIQIFSQACNQVDILYTEPDCYKTRDSNSGSPSGDPKACKQVSACEDQPYKYLSSLTGVGFTYLWAATGPAAVVFNPNNTTDFVNIVWPVPGVYTLTLTVTDGSGNISTNCLTINVKEKPVANFTFAPNNVCAGSTINFNNSSTFTGGMAYSWNFGDPSSTDNTSDQTNPSHIYNTPGTYTVCLITSSFINQLVPPKQGTQGHESTTIVTCCSDTLCRQIVIEPGTLKIDCISTVCANTIQTYTSNCANTIWNSVIGGTILSSTATQITIQWGNGALQGQIIATCPGSCTTSVPVPIIPSNPVPVGNLVPCLDALTSYNLPILPGTFYTWTLTNITTGVNNTTSLYTQPDNNTVWINWANLVPNGTDNYLLTVTLNNLHICCTTTGSITIKPRGTYTGFFDQTICLGDAANLSTFPSLGAFNWTVTPTTGVTPSSGSSSTFNPTFAISGNYVATVTETANTYCNSSTPQSFTIEVLPATPSPGFVTGPNQVCPTSTEIYSMSSAAPAGYHYTWTITGGTGTFMPGNLPSVTGNSANIEWTVVPGIISVVLERDNFPSCPSNAVTYNVSTVSGIGPITGTQNVCVDSQGNYTLTGVPSGTAVTWSIDAPNAALGTVTLGQGTPIVSILWHGNLNPSPWTATLRATTACGSVTYLITIYPKFTFTISQASDICQPGGAILTASTVANSPTYLWSNGTTTNPTSVTTPGFHSVTITNAGGCTFTKNIEVVDPFLIATSCSVGTCTPAGMQEILSVSVVKPASGTFTYQWFSGTFPGGTSVQGPVTNTSLTNTYAATSAGNYYVEVTYGTCVKRIQYSVAQVCCPDNNNPVITNVTQNTCFKFTFTATTSNSNPANWHWDFGDGSTQSGTLNPNHTYAFAGVYCVKFCVDGPGTCGVNCTITNVVVPIQASFIPILKCNGCLDVTNTSINLSSPPATVTYTWNYGDSTPLVVGQNPGPHCYANGGTYTVTLTQTYINGPITCTSVATQTITYTPLAMSIVPPTVCSGISSTFTSVPSSYVLYNWAFGDGNFAFTPSTTHIYATPNTYNVTLQVTDITGTVCSTNQTLTVQPGFTCTILPGYICPGGFATINGPTVVGATYLWEEFVSGNWVPATGTNNAINYTTAAPGQFRVTTTDPNGCICISNAVLVTAVPKPVAKIAVSPSRKLCVNGGIHTIFLSSVNHVGTDQSHWYLGSIAPANELVGSPSQTIATTIPGVVAGSYTFFLVHVNQYGCEDICSITVEVNPNPPAPVISSLPFFPVCEGQPYVLTATPGGAFTTWNTGQTGNTITVTNAGGYIATNTNPISGCSSASTTFVVNKKPSVSLFPHYCDDILCECHNSSNPFAIYAPRPLLGPFAPTYNVQWFNSPSNTPILTGLTNANLDYTNLPTGVQTGIYYINMTDPATGCTNKSETYNVTVPTFAECDKCSCENGSWGTITYSTINPSATYILQCPQIETIACRVPYQIFATYNCFSAACDSYVTYTITDPSGGVVSGTLPYTFVAPQTGTYYMELTGYCNGIKCQSCTITFNACPPLEVNLISFTGKKAGQTVELNWESASERINDYYIIERSDDGEKFTKLGQLSSKNSNSLEKLTYNYTDLFPNNGVNYYRLKAVDKDGAISNSKTIAVDFDEIKPTKLYPNPSKADLVTLEYQLKKETKVKLEWIDMAGRIVKTDQVLGNAGFNKMSLNVSKLPVGKYLLTIAPENQLAKLATLSFEKLD